RLGGPEAEVVRRAGPVHGPRGRRAVPGMKGALSQMATRVRGMGLAVEAVVVRFRRRRTRRRRYTSGTAAPYRRGKQGRVPVTISRTFAAAYEQVKAAREFVREQVGDDHPRAYDLMLVTSEL